MSFGTDLIPVAGPIIQGEAQRKAMKAGLRQQEQAQNEAKSLMERQQRSAEEEIARANKKKPDVASLLSSAKTPMALGSMLTGLGGVPQSKLSLGRSSLLGEPT